MKKVFVIVFSIIDEKSFTDVDDFYESIKRVKDKDSWNGIILCVSLLVGSFHFVSFRFVSFCFVFVLFRFVSFRFVSFRFVSFRFVSFRFVSFRFVSFR